LLFMKVSSTFSSLQPIKRRGEIERQFTTASAGSPQK
jgi:hypothetical protein